MHMISEKDLSNAEMDTLTKSCSPAIGEVQTHEEAIVYVKELEKFLTVKVLDNTPAVLSLGNLCDENGFSFEWINGQKPHLTKNGIGMPCITENFVPIVVPGLSSSSSGSSSTSKTPSRQESHSSSSSSTFSSSPSHASSSHEASLEPTAKRREEGKHSVHTHFPKGRNCEICERSRGSFGRCGLVPDKDRRSSLSRRLRLKARTEKHEQFVRQCGPGKDAFDKRHSCTSLRRTRLIPTVIRATMCSCKQLHFLKNLFATL